jgi:glycosyltransferase involved in cell wall biosynthesis
LGLEKTLNKGFRTAKGKYIARMDCDDISLPVRLKKQVDYMESNPECSLCVHAAYMVTAKKKKLKKHCRPNTGDKMFTVEEVILGGGELFATNSIMCPREYNTNLPKFYFDAPVGDYPLVIYLALQGTVYYFDQFMSAYRTGVDGSWSTNQIKGSIQKRTHLYEQIEKMLKEVDVYSKYKYSNAINIRILENQFNLMLIQGKFKEIKIGDYKEIYQKLNVKGKLLLIIKQYFPSSLKVLKYIRNKLFNI